VLCRQRKKRSRKVIFDLLKVSGLRSSAPHIKVCELSTHVVLYQSRVYMHERLSGETMPYGKSRLDASSGAPATAGPNDCDPINATQLLHLKQAGSSMYSGQLLRIMILLHLYV